MTHRNHPMLEPLESRQLFSVSPLAATAISALTPATTVAPKLLGPSAVEGEYHGEIYINTRGSTAADQIKVNITSTSITLYAVGYGKSTRPLTAKEFDAIRKGTFTLNRTIDGEAVTFTGIVTDSGDRISGSFTAGSGADRLSGTFVVKKVLTTT
jgi:hypothetical protein